MSTPSRSVPGPRLGAEPLAALRFASGFLALLTLVVSFASSELVGREFGALGLAAFALMALAYVAARNERARLAAALVGAPLLLMPVVSTALIGSFWVLLLALVPLYPAITGFTLGVRAANVCGVVVGLAIVAAGVALPEPLQLGSAEVPVLAGVTVGICATALVTLGTARALQTSELVGETARVLANVPDFVAILDRDSNRVLWANAAAHQALGYDDLVGLDARAFSRPDASDPDDLRAQIAQGCLRGVHVHRDGTEVRVEVHLTQMQAYGRRLTVACARDVSRVEQRLFDGERHALAAKLSTGLVHDFNNLLTVIHYAGLELDQVVGPDGRLAVDDLAAATERARGLVGSMQEFARGSRGAPQQNLIHERVRRTADLVRRVLPNSIALDVEIACQDPVTIGLTELDQILVNLVVNARDAMPDGGTIRIRLEQAASGVALRVDDDGIGMDAETLAQAQTPFFTTRGDSGGTGLGLAMVASMVSGVGAQLVLESTPGQGTRASVVFPDVIERLQASVILLVDDEELIRRAYRRTLRRQGLHTVEAGTAEAAMAILRSDQQVDLIISDWHMPGHDGGWLAEQAARVRPDVPTLLISGVHAPGQPASMLRKPLSSDELVEAACAALRQVPPAASSSVS